MSDYPSFRLDGRRALVTGAARGLGRAISLALADAGADVALGLRVGSDAADLAEHIEAMGRRAHRVQMDLLDLDQVRAAVDEIVDVFDGIDILVNNAGIGPPETPAEDWDEADFDAHVRPQREGSVLRQPGGRARHDRPALGHDHQPQLAGRLHRATGRSHLLRVEGGGLAPHQVPRRRVGPTRHHRQCRCAHVHPDAGHEPALSDPGFKAEVLERIAGVHRIGEPVDVAGAVVYLASPAASLVTGTTLMVDGGWTAR